MTSDLAARFPQAAYIDPSVRLFGAVEIGEQASLWPYTVVRAESRFVRIGRLSNLQDHVMVHVGYEQPTTIGDNCLIGIGATVMEGAVIGANSIVAGHSFVADGTVIPANSIVMGTPAKVVRTANNFVANRINAMLYQRNAQCYARGEHRGWEGEDYEREARRWRQAAEQQFAELYGS